MNKDEIKKKLEAKTTELEDLTKQIKEDVDSVGKDLKQETDQMNEEIQNIGKEVGDLPKPEEKEEVDEEEKKKLVQQTIVFLTDADKDKLLYENNLMLQELVRSLKK